MRAFFPLGATLALVAAAAGCASPTNPDQSGGAGATGNTTGAAGTGGTSTVAMCGPQTPPAASGGANFPFPQHRLSQSCSYPTNCTDADVQTSWATYKSKMIVSAGGSQLRVQRIENANDTVSEGLAYGMLFAVYMNDKATFDGIWAYAQTKRNGKGLLSWHLNSSGSIIDPNAATDADEDAAFALAMADKQWGGYASAATTHIAAILANEVDADNTLMPDDVRTQDVNPSYFAPAYYRVFAQVSGNSRWMQVLDRSYVLLEACANDQTGLVPDWCNRSGAGARAGNTPPGTRYNYDAARTPFRIAQDACWYNEARAKSYLGRVATFFKGVGPSAIKDGYEISGTVTGQYVSPTFEGPAGTAAMAASGDYADFMRQIYGRISSVTKAGTSSTYNYYNGSWGMMTLLFMTGNMANFQAL
jgi:endo-1,4-beta-D-glucanase Y